MQHTHDDAFGPQVERGVCKRGSGINCRSHGVQHTHDDAFGRQVPAEADRLHRWPSQASGGHERSAWSWASVQAMQRHRPLVRGRGGRGWRDGGAWRTCSTRTMMLSVRRCQPSQIGCTDGHRRRLSARVVHTNGVHDPGRVRAMQRHRLPLGSRGGRGWRDGGAWRTCSTRTMMLSVRRWLSARVVHTNGVHDPGRVRAMQRHRPPLGGRGGRAWRDGGAWRTCSTRTITLSVRR